MHSVISSLIQLAFTFYIMTPKVAAKKAPKKSAAKKAPKKAPVAKKPKAAPKPKKPTKIGKYLTKSQVMEAVVAESSTKP